MLKLYYSAQGGALFVAFVLILNHLKLNENSSALILSAVAYTFIVRLLMEMNT